MASTAAAVPTEGHEKDGSGTSKVRAAARNLLTVSLSRFYAQGSHMRELLPYIDGTAHISLRLIDWFVTNYAKTHNVVLTRRGASGDTTSFNVFLSYRAQLKAYSKQQFDPFRRRDRITFHYDCSADGGSVETTIGQLNFFRWMLTNNIISYVRDNAELIERDMIECQKAEKAAVSEVQQVQVQVQVQVQQLPKPGAKAVGDGRGKRPAGKRKEIAPCEAATRMSRCQEARVMSFC